MTHGIIRMAIIGAGGHGREIVQLVRDLEGADHRYEIIGFFDDDAALTGTTVGGLPVLGTVAQLRESRLADAFALGIGSPAIKRRLGPALVEAGLDAPSLVHPSAVVGRGVSIGPGATVCAGTVITCDVSVGSFVTLNLACTVSHDAVLASHSTFAPGVHVVGNVSVREGADLGAGATMVQGISIGEWSVVGAGAVVTRSLPANCTAVGVPARVIRTRETGWQLL